MKSNGSRRGSYVLITGGAGFIGSNLAHRLLLQGERVLVFDNLSRAGVEANWQWLAETYPGQVELEPSDIRQTAALQAAVKEASAIFHFAAQVAVTASLENPMLDFEINAAGTFHLLRWWRELNPQAPLIYTSTNKVYGSLPNLSIGLVRGRYEPTCGVSKAGISEAQPLEFYSPYGCSKGTADQYVLDHARTYQLPGVVFRMSCIYGPHQFGTEDQGWVAHFLLQARDRRPILIYGDGRQVRDLLFIDDLVEAFLLARKHVGRLSAQAFNIGGGRENAVSLLELIQLLEKQRAENIAVSFQNWRPGDQRYYVTNFDKFSRATGWKPAVKYEAGLIRLQEWLAQHSKVSIPTLLPA